MAGSMSVRRAGPSTCGQHLLAAAGSCRGAGAAETSRAGRPAGDFVRRGLRQQDPELNYGQVGTLGFRAFDLLVDGKYLDTEAFFDTLRRVRRPDRARPVSGAVCAGNGQSAVGRADDSRCGPYPRRRCREARHRADRPESGAGVPEIHRRPVPVRQECHGQPRRLARRGRKRGKSCLSLYAITISAGLSGAMPGRWPGYRQSSRFKAVT